MATENATSIELHDTSPQNSPNVSPQPAPRKKVRMMATVGRDESTARTPPLPISDGDEVIVVNGDRSNLTWKRYKLISIAERTGMCIVEGISDSRQRNFPRSVVKPKDWIDGFKKLFRAMATVDPCDEKDEKEKEAQQLAQTGLVEFKNFWIAMKLLGAKYDHEHALKIFKALDVRANGILSFGQFLNWVYGLGRTADKGRLLTTIECVTRVRQWNHDLAYYVMQMDDSDEGDKRVSWGTAKYDAAASDVDTVQLVENSESALAFTLPKHIKAFKKQFSRDMAAPINNPAEVYSPSNKEERECSVVVMGPGEIGKSALISKFVKGTFPHDYDPTIQDRDKKQILVDKEPALLDILDTAGQDEFASMRYDWLKDGIDILMICFSRADNESFIRAEALIQIAKRLLRQQQPPKIVPIMLVATKTDLHSEDTAALVVTKEDVDELRRIHGGDQFVGYMECSPLMDENVTEVFEEAVRMYRRWRSEGSSDDGDAFIKIRMPTIHEQQQAERRKSYMQSVSSTASGGRSKCVSCLARFCPALAAYMETDAHGGKKLNIASVPKDKFGDELAQPSYSKQHFFVKRVMSWWRLIVCLLTAMFFPLVVTAQTVVFVLYCPATNCCFKCLPEDTDYTDQQESLVFDFLGPIVGRDPRQTSKSEDARKWFMSQTNWQKFTRVLITAFADGLFFFAIYNALNYGLSWFNDNAAADSQLAIVETLGPMQLWAAMWLILAIYMSLDIDVKPEPPSMQALRPYVMYLNADESIRTTAYVFLRGFAKSTFSIFRLEATSERVITSLIVAVLWILIPGATRVIYGVEGGGTWLVESYHFTTISSMAVSFVFVFVLILGLQMQLLSGLVKYIDWMDDITSMLDEVFSKDKELHYINLTRHNNMLAWLEMRTYMYTKGLIIFSRQEIFVLYVILLQVASALYLLQRLMSSELLDDGSDFKSTFSSPSVVAVFFMFLCLTYSLLRIMRTTRMIEKLQDRQVALLAAQKFQIYYKRITWHPDEESTREESAEGGDVDPFDADFGIDLEALPELDDDSVVEESDDDSDQKHEEDMPLIESPSAGKGGQAGAAGDGAREDDALLSVDDDVAPIDKAHTYEMDTLMAQTSKSVGSSGSPNPRASLRMTSGTQLKLRRTRTRQFMNGAVEKGEQLFSADYLEQSEKFVQAAMNICEAQDIIPRIFNIKVQVAVGLSILATGFAVLPTAARLAFGDDCQAWSD